MHIYHANNAYLKQTHDLFFYYYYIHTFIYYLTKHYLFVLVFKLFFKHQKTE